MKFIYISIVFLALISIATPGISATEEHGPLIKFFYAPWGIAGNTLPYSTGTASSSEKTYAMPGTGTFDYYSGYAITGGYYYDFLQCEASYSSAKIKNREVAISDQRSDPVATNYSYVDFKFGFRFSKPGDTSYSFLFAGAKKTSITSSFSDTNAATLGYIVGFSGFKSIGLVSSIEFVLSFEIYGGSASYDYNKIKFDSTFSAEEKTSYDFGMSMGIGLQYEPYNITCLFKIVPVVHINEQKSGNERIGASIYGGYFGFELLYTLPSVKYNSVD